MLRIAKTENGLTRGLPAPDPRITVFKGIQHRLYMETGGGHQCRVVTGKGY